MENITVGTKTYTVYQAPIGLRDPAIWRLENTAIPAMFRSTIAHTASLNASKTNVNETITVEVPLPVQDTDTQLWSAKNKIFASAKFTSLQGVVAPTESALALDALIAVLTARRAQILAGKTAD